MNTPKTIEESTNTNGSTLAGKLNTLKDSIPVERLGKPENTTDQVTEVAGNPFGNR